MAQSRDLIGHLKTELLLRISDEKSKNNFFLGGDGDDEPRDLRRSVTTLLDAMQDLIRGLQLPGMYNTQLYWNRCHGKVRSRGSLESLLFS